MPWKCPSCGIENIPDATTSCGCGYAKFPAGVLLRSEVSGGQIEIKIETLMGNANLRRLNDPDIRFVAAEQFKVEKSTEMGGWLLKNCLSAKNPTWVNGAPVDLAGFILKEGDRLSVKDKFKLTVSLL